MPLEKKMMRAFGASENESWAIYTYIFRCENNQLYRLYKPVNI